MRVPGEDKKLIVTNGKNAYQGTIAYTKNIDLSEDGYVKLAAPLCRLYSSEDDVDFGLPIDIFRNFSGTGFKVLTSGRFFNFTLSNLNFSQDASSVLPNDNSRVVQWVGGNWFIGADDVYEFTGATPDTVYTSKISAALEYIEVFVNRDSLVGTLGNNTLKQYDDTYANTTDLVLPQNFVITGTAFSNLQMGVVTRQGKNRGDAYFFLWDGSTSEADNGYPIDDPYILALRAYNSSWILITSGGELLYFNGGGFEQKGVLPIFDRDIQLISLGPNNSVDFGNIMDVNGDRVYVNCGSLPEISESMKPYLPFFSAGAFCYDPQHGFYHMHAPSYSEYSEEEGTVSSSVISFSESHYLETGDEVWCENGSLGLSDETIYYAIKQDDDSIKLAATYEDAMENTSIALTNGSIDLFFVKRLDFGIESMRLQDAGLVKNDRAFDGYYESGALSFFLGANIRPNNVAAERVKVLCAKIPIMSNRGYVVYSRFQTSAEDEMWQAVVVKHRRLKPGSSIVVKARTKDQDEIIVGSGSLYDAVYTGESVTWDSNGNYFETTADLTGADEDDEVHIFDGAGAGQSAQIQSIEKIGSVWQVTLDEMIRGVSAGAKSCVCISAFRKLGVITSDDDSGMRRLPLGSPAESMDIKLELRGRKVAVKEVMPVSDDHQTG